MMAAVSEEDDKELQDLADYLVGPVLFYVFYINFVVASIASG